MNRIDPTSIPDGLGSAKDMGLVDGDGSHGFDLDGGGISIGFRTRLWCRGLGHWQLHLLPLSNQLCGSHDLDVKPHCTGSHGHLLWSSWPS